ncbi:ATP-dependent helicase HrpB [Paenibacillus oleatilyticus]|uniref:ATP-dependent helicase HrpB n=1 Tax=Paenibacillus oleatilyticus TaxID=2594886 RepID=UPI001C1F6A73|nr:ATP-dependent helicase HrpB [Paenibacillus oleatilyticus]MBU7317433.1 ATP-dependent helicase HrpB [Paenibacillus oleatilyticus]
MGEPPIDRVLMQLKEKLNEHTNAVLVAPPGAGKTTRVPLALLDEPWVAGRKIMMLEPRRLAARAAARYMASRLGEQVGETVGYRVRLDTKVGPKTRIEVITEGVLTRLLQADPALEDVAAVIFDEFHERSLHADLGLAFALESQAVLRDDLRILVMSATLDAAPVAALMRDAPVVVSEGRSYPVETRYLSKPVEGKLEPALAACIRQALAAEEGDLLAFLPGAGEIRRVERLLLEAGLGPQVRIAPLYGQLAQGEQDAAIAPGVPGQRKVVLATSIAESSLTVEGVRIVVDGGRMRVPRFSPRTGMTRLETVTVTRDSADQRRGRAGRTAPGVCYRLWTEQEDRRLAPHRAPEIMEADLAALALELAAWGVADPAQLAWLTPPPAAAYGQAVALLKQLGALGDDGAITPHGRRMAELGVSPRLAHMMLRAVPLGLGGLACELAALLSDRDLLRSRPDSPNADLRLRVEALRGAGNAQAADPAARRRIVAEAEQGKRALGVPLEQRDEVNACGMLLAFAYPDRIAQTKGSGRFLLSGGRGGSFAGPQPLYGEKYLVVAELDDQGADGRIDLAAPISEEQLHRVFADDIETETAVAWDRAAQAVRARKREKLGVLTLREAPVEAPDPEQVLNALPEGIVAEGLSMLPWTKAAKQLRERIGFMHQVDPAWPDVSDEALLAGLKEWLGPHLYGLKSRDDLQRLSMAAILDGMLPWPQRQQLDDFVPTHITVPSGSRIPVDYSDPASPVLAVRLQELFGLRETPRIGGGKVPLLLHLLSPAHRPVQVTRDLASFWQDAYFEVKKDLKGRYPKHVWPDDPLTALPTNRAKPRV